MRDLCNELLASFLCILKRSNVVSFVFRKRHTSFERQNLFVDDILRSILCSVTLPELIETNDTCRIAIDLNSNSKALILSNFNHVVISLTNELNQTFEVNCVLDENRKVSEIDSISVRSPYLINYTQPIPAEVLVKVFQMDLMPRNPTVRHLSGMDKETNKNKKTLLRLVKV